MKGLKVEAQVVMLRGYGGRTKPGMKARVAKIDTRCVVLDFGTGFPRP